MSSVLSKATWDIETGTHHVAGDRYVLIRAESLTVGVQEELEKVLGSGKDAATYRLGKALGSTTCRKVASTYPDFSREQILALGPIAFALNGFSKTTIREESNLAFDDSFLMFYEHSNSFEAESFKQNGITTPKTACWLSAGFVAGWCTEALGFNVESREVSCTARGDDKCIFVMCVPKKLREVSKDLCTKHGIASDPK